MLDPFSEGNPQHRYAAGGILLGWFGSTCPLRGKGLCSVVLGNHFYPMMKHVYFDGSGIFQDDN